METYGQRLRRWMKARNIRPAWLASTTGRTRQALYDLLNDRTQAQTGTHESICRALGIHPKDFFATMLDSIENKADDTGVKEVLSSAHQADSP